MNELESSSVEDFPVANLLEKMDKLHASPCCKEGWLDVHLLKNYIHN